MTINKFKVWDKINKCWLNYDDIYVDQDGEVYEIEERTWAYQSYMNKENISDKVEIVRMTGMKDKNNVEMFEGDLFYWNDTLRQIVYRDDKASFMAKRISGKTNNDRYFYLWNLQNLLHKVEIIGNIYENADLISQ